MRFTHSFPLPRRSSEKDGVAKKGGEMRMNPMRGNECEKLKMNLMRGNEGERLRMNSMARKRKKMLTALQGIFRFFFSPPIGRQKSNQLIVSFFSPQMKQTRRKKRAFLSRLSYRDWGSSGNLGCKSKRCVHNFVLGNRF